LFQVAEYGGNLHGYGSKSVLGSGWPKEVLKVEGDTVTLSFEMRSGREHNTPDRALWGFKVKKRSYIVLLFSDCECNTGLHTAQSRLRGYFEVEIAVLFT
jgi:hypothetical protein